MWLYLYKSALPAKIGYSASIFVRLRDHWKLRLWFLLGWTTALFSASHLEEPILTYRPKRFSVLHQGTELYPRIGGDFDIKVWTNCRMGMMSWGILPLCYIAKQYELFGEVYNSILISVLLMEIYVFKFFWWVDAGCAVLRLWSILRVDYFRPSCIRLVKTHDASTGPTGGRQGTGGRWILHMIEPGTTFVGDVWIGCHAFIHLLPCTWSSSKCSYPYLWQQQF